MELVRGESPSLQAVFCNSRIYNFKSKSNRLIFVFIKVCFYPLDMTFSKPCLTLDDVTSFKGQLSTLIAKDLVSVKQERLNLGAGQCSQCTPITRGLGLGILRMSRSLMSAPAWCLRFLKMYIGAGRAGE